MRVFVCRAWLSVFLLWTLATPAAAAVEIAFYSRELGGNNFPHAFVSLRGTVDATGERVDTSYGFTARAISPGILFGSVAGEVVVEGPQQIARSTRQFAMTLDDARYRAVMAVVGVTIASTWVSARLKCAMKRVRTRCAWR